MNHRNLLLVAYHFPPIGGSGVQRALKLARYLPDCGWHVHVLTAAHRRHPLLDETMLEELGKDVHIHRVAGLEPGAVAAGVCRPLRRRVRAQLSSWIEDRLYWRLDRAARYLPLSEVERLWVPAAVRAAKRIIRAYGIHAVITTSPPHAVQWVGRKLQRTFDIPCIADLRDPILDNFAYLPKSYFDDQRQRRLERTIVGNSTRVVITCPELIGPLRKRYPDASRSKFTVIPNGYDPSDTPPEKLRLRQIAGPARGRFILAHVGAFYKDQSILPILNAMRRLIAAHPNLAGRIELRLVGSLSAQQVRFLRHTDDVFLQQIGYKPHREAISEMIGADALFLMTPANDGGRFCIPAKTFEYLAFGNHVIALVHANTALARLLQRAGNVTIVSQDRSDALTEALRAAIIAWSNKVLQQPRDQSAIRRLGRDRLAAAYAGLLDRCCEQPPAAARSDATAAPIVRMVPCLETQTDMDWTHAGQIPEPA